MLPSRKTAAALLLAAALAHALPAAARAQQGDTTAARSDTSRSDTARADTVRSDTLPPDTAAGADTAAAASGPGGGGVVQAAVLVVTRAIVPLLALGALGYATVFLARAFAKSVSGGQAAEVTSHWGGLGGGLGGWRISPALSYLLGALFFGSLLTFLALRVMDAGSGSAAGETERTETTTTQQTAKQTTR